MRCKLEKAYVYGLKENTDVDILISSDAMAQVNISDFSADFSSRYILFFCCPRIMVFQSQDLGAKLDHCYWNALASKLSHCAELGNIFLLLFSCSIMSDSL